MPVNERTPNNASATGTSTSVATEWVYVPAGVEIEADPGTAGSGNVTIQKRVRGGDGTVYPVVDLTPGTDAPVVISGALPFEYRMAVTSYTSGTFTLNLWY